MPKRPQPPKDMKLDQNGTFPIKQMGFAVSTDKQAARIDFYDGKGQLLPLALTQRMMADLFVIIAAASAQMADSDPATGKPRRPAIINTTKLPAGTDFAFGFQYDAPSQLLRLTIGGVGLDIPYPREAALALARSLETEPPKRTLQ